MAKQGLEDRISELEKMVSLLQRQVKSIIRDKFLTGDYPFEPLTKEKLLEFGFKMEAGKNNSSWSYWVKGAFNLEVKNNGEVWFELYSHYRPLKYVHDLKSLYSALTGEELTKQQKP